jgi:hypothetical protein
MIFKIFLPKNSAKKLAFLTKNKANLCKMLIITLVFKKNANFFAKNCQKIAENCDHNIDPWSHSRQWEADERQCSRALKKQGDRIGRFFAHWVIVYFGQCFENYRTCTILWASIWATISRTHLVTLPTNTQRREATYNGRLRIYRRRLYICTVKQKKKGKKCETRKKKKKCQQKEIRKSVGK